VASPQVEDGFIRIANELFRAAVRMLPAGKLKVFWAVWSFMYGWRSAELEFLTIQEAYYIIGAADRGKGGG
jgi:hypothetical protein